MKVVSHSLGWFLIGDYALAVGDPCMSHVIAEGYC